MSNDDYRNIIGDIHVQFNSETFPLFNQSQNIHIVNPKILVVYELVLMILQIPKKIHQLMMLNTKKIGTYKDEIPRHLYFASKCSECLDNFYISLKHINRSTKCEAEGDRQSVSDGNGCTVRI